MSTAIDPLDEFKEAYAILDGIPDERIELGAICDSDRRKINCGTIACGVGWLLHHPRYQARGFGYHARSWRLKDGVDTYFDSQYAEVASLMLGISEADAERVFSAMRCRAECYDGAGRLPGPSDKQVLLARMRSYIASHAATAKEVA